MHLVPVGKEKSTEHHHCITSAPPKPNVRILTKSLLGGTLSSLERTCRNKRPNERAKGPEG